MKGREGGHWNPMQRHNRKYTVYLEQSVRGPRSIIPEESHPSVPIHVNGNCSAGTALSKSAWFQICSWALWMQFYDAITCDIKCCVTNHFVEAGNYDMTIRLMSPQEHAQAQTIYYSELRPVPNDTKTLQCSSDSTLANVSRALVRT